MRVVHYAPVRGQSLLFGIHRRDRSPRSPA